MVEERGILSLEYELKQAWAKRKVDNMSICKFCQAQITWSEDNGRNRPHNLDGALHQCKKSAPSEPVRTVEEIAKERDAYNAKALSAAGFVQPGEPMATVPTQSSARYTEEQLTLMRAKVAPNCTQTEFELLMYIANKYQLDPLIRQIWAIKYEGKPALIFAGRDGFLEIAHRSGHFDGMKSDCVYDEKGALVSAWCEVWRNDMTHSFRSSVLFSEYTTGMNLWKTKPSVMLLKCAESVCLRKAFSVSGLYSPEEIGEPQ